MAEHKEPKEMNMKWVDLVEFDAAARKGEVLVRVLLEGGHVRFEGNADLVGELEKNGVFSTSAMKMVMPNDGEDFLRALGEQYNNAYLFATGVKEGEKPTPYEPPPVTKLPANDTEPKAA